MCIPLITQPSSSAQQQAMTTDRSIALFLQEGRREGKEQCHTKEIFVDVYFFGVNQEEEATGCT
jgi:hypothetical protein